MAADQGPALLEKMILLHQALVDPMLSKTDVTLLALILEAINKRTGTAWPSVKTIAETMGKSERSVQRATANLVGFGYLEVELGGHGRRYATNRYSCATRVTELSPIAIQGMTPESPKGDKSGRKRVTELSPQPILDNPVKNPGAKSPKSTADQNEKLRQLNRSARANGIDTQQPDESVDDYERRFNATYGRKLAAMAEAQRKPGKEASESVMATPSELEGNHYAAAQQSPPRGAT